jgi:hypothetical protein
LTEEVCDHRAVPALVDAWSVRVEVADDHDRQLVRRVCKRKVLVDRFRGRVRPPMHGRRSEHAIVVLLHRDERGLAVDLRCACKDHLAPKAKARAEYVLGSTRIRENRVEWILDDVANANRRGEVKHQLRSLDLCIDELGIEDRTVDEVQIVDRLRKICSSPRRQVVEHPNGVAGFAQRVHEVRADVSSTPRDQHPHRENVTGRTVAELRSWSRRRREKRARR